MKNINKKIKNKKKYSLPYYKICNLECIEIGLWPSLHINEEWCETKVKGQVSFAVYNFLSIFHMNFDKQTLSFLRIFYMAKSTVCLIKIIPKSL